MLKPEIHACTRCGWEFIPTRVKRDEMGKIILRHKSASGMSRRISVIQIEKNEPRWLDYNVAKALGRREKQDEGIIVEGAGMDMGFNLVYTPSQTLFKDGYALKHRWL